MKKAAVLILALLMTAGVVYAKEYEVSKKAGGYDVVVMIDHNPPVTGDNTVSITVKDGAGKIVKDAKVVVDYSMPAMPGMPAMNYKAAAVQKGESYQATMNLSMGGSWNVAVKIARGGKTSVMKFTVDAK